MPVWLTRIWQNRYPYLFLVPSFLGVGVFVLIPFADVVRRSFCNAAGTAFVGLENYQTVCANEAFRLAAGNTIRFLAVCIPLLLALSLGAALLVCSFRRGREFVKAVFLMPMAIPVAAVVLFWRLAFDKEGIVNQIVSLFSMQGTDWMHTDAAFWVLVFAYIWRNLGYDMVLWIAGLAEIPESIYEAARIDGAGKWNIFCRITMPLLAPYLFLTGVLSLVNGFKVYREAWLIAGNYPQDSMYMLQHVFNNWFLRLDMQKMTAGAVLTALAIAFCLAIVQKVSSRKGENG